MLCLAENFTMTKHVLECQNRVCMYREKIVEKMLVQHLVW